MLEDYNISRSNTVHCCLLSNKSHLSPSLVLINVKGSGFTLEGSGQGSYLNLFKINNL